jgi:iron complex outermembrane receptor protein
VILQAYWSLHQWSVNLRETVYGPVSEITNFDGFNEKISATGITDLDIGYKLTPQLKLDVGANNLFNQFPPKTPNDSTGRPVDGGEVYGVPYSFAPWGNNGGYYYGRITYSF